MLLSRRSLLRHLPLTALASTLHIHVRGQESRKLWETGNSSIDKPREIALNLLKPTQAQLEHAWELHFGSTVFESYGFAPRFAVDGERINQAVSEGASAEASPAAASAKSAPAASAAALVGNWTSKPQAGVEIKLAMTADGKFTWNVSANGKGESFAGTYRLNGKTLTLARANVEQPMEGTVEMVGADGFRFRRLKATANDPGLSFKR